MTNIYPDARAICGETLNFKTARHKHHKCIVGFPHVNEKHRCECGVKWTKDPELAAKPEHGEKWSSEQVIYQAPGPDPAPPDGYVGPFSLDPTKNYNNNHN
jgi:hypothetical protein